VRAPPIPISWPASTLRDRRGMKVVYLDVNGISFLADHPDRWSPFRSWLQAEDSWLALTDAHLAELHDVVRKHRRIAEFFCRP
jgi:hypothetical protein